MKRYQETGQTLIFTALALVFLSGFAGMAIDMGVLRYEKRLQQTAADAAAIAGASNLAYSGVTAGAKNASGTNGFADTRGASGCPSAVGCVTVTINNPPVAGPHTGDAKYVEALVAAVQPTYFMKLLGVSKETIAARAVATNVSGGANGGCLYTLNPKSSGIEGININGNATLDASTCGIVDNGNFNTSGSAFNVNAATFGVAGDPPGNKGTVKCSQTPTSCPTNPVPVSGDPLSYLTAPAQPSPNFGKITTSGTQTLQPGTYTSLTIGKNSAVTMNAGIYYINGAAGITFNGGGSVTGSGVMFFFTKGATIDATGGGNKLDINLTPPTSGPYAGILMYQDPNDTKGPRLGSDNNSSLGGALYFPKAEVTFFGNASSSTGIVVAAALALSGHPTVTLQGSAGLPPGVAVIKNAILVE